MSDPLAEAPQAPVDAPSGPAPEAPPPPPVDAPVAPVDAAPAPPADVPEIMDVPALPPTPDTAGLYRVAHGSFVLDSRDVVEPGGVVRLSDDEAFLALASGAITPL